MWELVVQMVFWLLAAIVLGFMFGWVLSNVQREEDNEEEVASLKATLEDKNQIIETLKQEVKVEEQTHKTIKSGKIHPHVKILQLEIERLKKVDEEREKELEEFEKVLLKAEETITLLRAENSDKVKLAERYRETILALEGELKLYRSGKDGSEFIISKDQFVKIEEQLLNYQKEIELLKNERRKVRGYVQLEGQKIG